MSLWLTFSKGRAFSFTRPARTHRGGVDRVGSPHETREKPRPRTPRGQPATRLDLRASAQNCEHMQQVRCRRTRPELARPPRATRGDFPGGRLWRISSQGRGLPHTMAVAADTWDAGQHLVGARRLAIVRTMSSRGRHPSSEWRPPTSRCRRAPCVPPWTAGTG